MNFHLVKIYWTVQLFYAYWKILMLYLTIKIFLKTQYTILIFFHFFDEDFFTDLATKDRYLGTIVCLRLQKNIN